MNIIQNNKPCPRPKERAGEVIAEGRWRARRPASSQYVYGFLVKSKVGGIISGIINENSRYEQEKFGDEDPHYAELAWIDESTLERWDDKPAEYCTADEIADYRRTHPEARPRIF